MKHIFGTLAGACLLSPLVLATVPAGNTLFVANNGVDSPGCGAVVSPCRSISQGVANSQPGDTLLVKPGRYGDLNFDGVLASPGEETGPGVPGSLGGVLVSKRLTILSTDGAEATVIDVAGGSSAAVEITADGVHFGEKNAGFTLIGGRDFGLYSERTNIVVAGNLARNANFAGFMLHSSGTVEARHNTATGSNSAGFWVTTNLTSSAVVTNNFAFGNNTGIVVGGPGPSRVISNEVSGNETGISIDFGPARVAQNQIAQNRFGLMINGFSSNTPAQGPLVTHNNIIGNRQLGVYVLPGPPGTGLRIRENNLYGHDPCALGSQSNVIVDARHNFWGAATGPSFQDPADGDCSAAGATVTTPFATTEFNVH